VRREDKIESLANLIRLFGGRHNHLAKFLVDNGAVSDAFIRRIDCSALENKSDFSSISELEGYYASALGSEVPVAEVDLTERLARLIEEEKYEDAARLRDYMRKIRKGKP
jgi:hypothetical protein